MAVAKAGQQVAWSGVQYWAVGDVLIGLGSCGIGGQRPGKQLMHAVWWAVCTRLEAPWRFASTWPQKVIPQDQPNVSERGE
jgi:hypothetical protein